MDLEKAFDWINRGMLLYKLLVDNIDGKMYYAMKSLLSNTSASVPFKLNDFHLVLASGKATVSPTLFSLFINDLVAHLKETCLVLKLGNAEINSLLYADDMVLIGESDQALQSLLDEVYKWCYKWRLKVNESKTEVLHFQKTKVIFTNVAFKYGNSSLEKVSSYKYRGIIMDVHLKFDLYAKALAGSGGRAL